MAAEMALPLPGKMPRKASRAELGDRIFVVGDFNDWCATATPMRQDRDGVWRMTVDLLGGSRCEFRYLIDGQWKIEQYVLSFSVPNDASKAVVEAIAAQKAGAAAVRPGD